MEHGSSLGNPGPVAQAWRTTVASRVKLSTTCSTEIVEQESNIGLESRPTARIEENIGMFPSYGVQNDRLDLRSANIQYANVCMH